MKQLPYNIFWQRLHQAAKTKAFPLRVMFELTYRCNFKCKHCYVPSSYRKKRELNTKEVFSVLDQLKDIGCFYLGFTGGEPFVRGDIMDILWYAKKKGFQIIIYTNGSLIDKNRAAELSDLAPNKVDITIPAISKEAFERISGLPGARKKVFRAVELLHKRKVNLGFKTCVLKANQDEIEQIRNFAYSLGALHRLDETLSSRLDGSPEPYKYRGTWKTRGSELEPDAGECRQHNPALGGPVMRVDPALFKCGVGLSQVAITPSGELKMCLMIDHPKYKILAEGDAEDAADQGLGLDQAWQRLKQLVASIKPDRNYQCATCSWEPYCKWCPARAWLHQRNFTSCDPQSRQKARLNCPEGAAAVLAEQKR